MKREQIGAPASRSVDSPVSPRPRTPIGRAYEALARRRTDGVARTEIDRSAFAVRAVAVIVVAITYARIYFGADFTDQAYYVAIPYRFVLGARPFIDETTPSQQMAGLLAFPFIWAYHTLFGVTAIILFA